MITPTPVLGEIVAKFGVNIKGYTRNNEVIYCCPECQNRGLTPDIKGHLWVKNSYPILYHCWRCNYSGRLDYHNKKFSRPPEPEPDQAELMSLIEQTIYKPKSAISELLPIPKIIPMPHTREHDYLLSRGLDQAMIDYYNIRLGLVGSKYRNRIIVPNAVIQGKQDSDYDYTDMFVARYIGDPPDDTSDFRKYLNPPGNNKSKTVFNLHRIKSNTPIIITEGVFTAMAAGPQAVATYGKQVSDYQIISILQKFPSKIYVNLDPDAYEESNELCERIQQMTDIPVYQVKFGSQYGPHADASDIPRSKYKEYIKLATLFDPIKVAVGVNLGYSNQYLDDMKVCN